MMEFSLLRVVVVFILALLPTAFCAPKQNPQKTEVSGNCNFDSSTFCNWHQVSEPDDKFDWSLDRDSTPSSGTGPIKDVSEKGYYAYIESSAPRKGGDKARLMTGPLKGVYCLRFAYNMYGRTIGQLNIYHVLHGSELNIWWRKGQQTSARQWKTDNVTVYGNNYYIIIEGVTGNSYTGDIAIDEISFVKGSCRGEPVPTVDKEESEKNVSDRCDFDLGFCDWGNDLSGVGKKPWRLSSYRDNQVPESVAARQDHGKKLGGKFVFSNRQPQQQATVSRLISRSLCGPKCLELYYFMKRFRGSELRVSKRIDSKEDRLWFTTGVGAQTEDWTRALVDIKEEHENCYQLVFESRLSGARESVVGLDDVFTTNGSCCSIRNTPEKTEKANCDFDKGTFCNWGHSTKSSFAWSLGGGQTKSGKESGGMTGPTTDASGKGQYAYIESSEPRMKGDKAVMVSDLLSGQQCMQFKYHMYGEDVGSLSVYRRGILQWKESGNHGDQWLEGQVDLDCSIEEYHVEIEASVEGWRGDIALDELQFTPGLCPIKTNVSAVSPANRPVILPTPPQPYRTCTFSQSLCGWTNALNDSGDWKIYADDTPSFNTGPHYDFDGNGFYIYMEASDLLDGQEVRLESETLRIPVCLSFSYYMYGEDVKELRLEQRNSMNNETKVVWTKKGEQGDYWNFQLQELKGEQYTISFVAVRGKSYLSDIAIDEISILDVKECKSLSGKAGKQPNQKDGNCDFDKGFCKWQNVKDNVFDWTRNSGRTPSSATGPSFDHTKGQTRPKGHYIYVEASNPRRRGDTALLLLKLEGSSFCMRFWYHMYGRDMGSLKIVHIIKQGTTKDEPANDDQPKTIEFTQGLRGSRDTRKIAWQKSGNHRNKWHQAELDLKHGKSAVHWIGIVGVIGKSYTSDMAVDDIQFTTGRCSSRRKA